MVGKKSKNLETTFTCTFFVNQMLRLQCPHICRICYW